MQFQFLKSFKKSMPDGINWDRLFMAASFLGAILSLYKRPQRLAFPISCAMRGVECVVETINSSKVLAQRPQVAMTLTTAIVGGLPGATVALPSYFIYSLVREADQTRQRKERYRDELAELGRIAVNTGNYIDALHHFQDAIRIHKEVSHVNRMCFFYQIAPRGDVSYDRLIDLSSWEANTLFLVGRYPEACDKFTAILELQPDDGLTLRMRGFTNMMLGELTLAHNDFAAYLQLDHAGHGDVKVLEAFCSNRHREAVLLANTILYIGMDITENSLWATLRRERLAHIVLDKIARVSFMQYDGERVEEARAVSRQLEFTAYYNIFQHCRNLLNLDDLHNLLGRFEACCNDVGRHLGDRGQLVVPLIGHEFDRQGQVVIQRVFNQEALAEFRNEILSSFNEISTQPNLQ